MHKAEVHMMQRDWWMNPAQPIICEEDGNGAGIRIKSNLSTDGVHQIPYQTMSLTSTFIFILISSRRYERENLRIFIPCRGSHFTAKRTFKLVVVLLVFYWAAKNRGLVKFPLVMVVTYRSEMKLPWAMIISFIE